MYPSLQSSSSGPPPPPSSSSYYPTIGQSPPQQYGQPVRANGPAPPPPSGQPSSSGSGSNFPLLRVQIADRYRTFPPVMVSPGLDEISRTQFTASFDFERGLVARLEADERGGGPSQEQVLRFTAMGYEQEEVAVALVACSDDQEPEDKACSSVLFWGELPGCFDAQHVLQVVDFCKNYRELRSMGFDALVVAGALMLHKNDIGAATEACLAHSSLAM